MTKTGRDITDLVTPDDFLHSEAIKRRWPPDAEKWVDGINSCKRPKRSQEEIDEIFLAINQGKSLRELGDIYGVTAERIRQVFAKETGRRERQFNNAKDTVK